MEERHVLVLGTACVDRSDHHGRRMVGPAPDGRSFLGVADEPCPRIVRHATRGASMSSHMDPQASWAPLSGSYEEAVLSWHEQVNASFRREPRSAGNTGDQGGQPGPQRPAPDGSPLRSAP
jgi:hypothetical protein